MSKELSVFEKNLCNQKVYLEIIAEKIVEIDFQI